MATNLCVGTSNQALKPIKKQQLKRHDLNLKVIAKKSFNFITLSIHVRETDKYPLHVVTDHMLSKPLQK